MGQVVGRMRRWEGGGRGTGRQARLALPRKVERSFGEDGPSAWRVVGDENEWAGSPVPRIGPISYLATILMTRADGPREFCVTHISVNPYC